jgi:hypothetical protein
MLRRSTVNSSSTTNRDLLEEYPVTTIDRILLPALKRIPKELGSTTKITRLNDSRFVVTLIDDPRFPDVSLSVAAILEALLRTRTISLVGVDGAFGPVEALLFRAFPDQDIRREVAGQFIQERKLRAAEYAAVSFEHQFVVLGVDEQQVYMEGLGLWREFLYDEFSQWQRKRSAAICRRFLQEMAERDTQVAALTLCGELPEYVVADIAKAGFSSALVRPRDGELQLGEAAEVSNAVPKDFLCNLLLTPGADNQLISDSEDYGLLKNAKTAINDVGFPNFDVSVAIEVIREAHTLLVKGDYQESLVQTRRGWVMWSCIERSLREKERLEAESDDTDKRLSSVIRAARERRDVLEQQLSWFESMGYK